MLKIVDLTTEHESVYFQCLEDWSDEMKEAGDHRACWYRKMKDLGLCVKLALDDNGTVGGMIQSIPVEYSPALGEDLYFILCIWVHGYKQGRGNFQKKGMGKAMLKAAEEDAVNRSAKGIAAWGLGLPFWMKASWFRKQGYVKTDRNGIQILLWKPLSQDAQPPKWIRTVKKPEKEPGKVKVTCFYNGYCPVQNLLLERSRRASAEFGDHVEFVAINTFDREKFLEWGISGDLYIDDRRISRGPPLPYLRIRKSIEKK